MKMHNLDPKNFILEEIESIELIGEEETIDISVEDTHMFFANDIYSHNSSETEEFVAGHHTSDSYKKLMVGDFVFSWQRRIDDKINDTGMAFLIKNRFGPDGIPLPADANMKNGRIQMHETNTNIGQEKRSNRKNGEATTKKLLKQRLDEIGIEL